MADIMKILEDARNEVKAEFESELKRKFKGKLRTILAARRVLANLESELEVLAEAAEEECATAS